MHLREKSLNFQLTFFDVDYSMRVCLITAYINPFVDP